MLGRLHGAGLAGFRKLEGARAGYGPADMDHAALDLQLLVGPLGEKPLVRNNRTHARWLMF